MKARDVPGEMEAEVVRFCMPPELVISPDEAVAQHHRAYCERQRALKQEGGFGL